MDFKENVKESPKKKTLASEYKNMEQDRETYLTKAKEAAKYTIPSLIKNDNNGNQVQTYEQPNQSIGADGVNNLSAKVTLAMLPPNQPFFKFHIDAADLKRIATESGQDPEQFEAEVTRGLSMTEQLLVDYNEQIYYKHIHNKYNVLFAIDDDIENIKMFYKLGINTLHCRYGKKR